MKRMQFRAWALLLLLAAGCTGGGNNMTGPVGFTARANVSGSYGITGMSQTTSQSYLIGGIFQNDGNGNITGVARVDRSACFDFGVPVTFSGSVNSQNQLTLTSASINGQVITLSGSVSSDGKTISGGTFSISGGCASGDHGTTSGFQVQGVAGTYSGTFLIAGHPVTVTAAITQENGGNTGASMLTGTISFTINGALCDLPTNTNVSFAGVAAGSDVHISVQNTLSGTATFVGAATDGTGKTITGTIDLTNTCAGDIPSLTLAQ